MSPFVGAYVPAGDFAKIERGPTTAGSSSESVRQDIASAQGVSLIGWAGRKLALAVAVGYSSSGTVTQGTVYSVFPTPGRLTYEPINSNASGSVFTASARALICLAPSAPGHVLPYLIAGLGWVGHHGGSPAGETNDFGPDLGVGLRLPLTSWLSPWVEGQFLTITQAASGLGPNLLLSAGVPMSL